MIANNNYSTNNNIKKVVFALLFVVVVLIGTVISASVCKAADERLATCWILCKPGTQVNARKTPDKRSDVVGYLEVGDEVKTDGVSHNGYIRVYGIGEHGVAYVFCGYVATEKPVKVGERYICTSNSRVACRKWMNGPQVSGKPWLVNGSTVSVFCIADGWAVTSRGYIRSEWLEADPE